MTLRSQIHRAIDEVTPPAPELRVKAFTAIANPKRGGGSVRVSRPNALANFRWGGAIAAALIAILLLVAVLVGGRTLRDWRAYSAHQHDLQVFQQQLSQLRSRPLILPALKVTDPGPQSKSVTKFDYGAGPVYANGGGSAPNDWGDFTNLAWYTDPHLQGPVLIRGRDMSHGTLIVFVDRFAAGPVVGVAHFQGVTKELHSELVVDAGNPPERTPDGYGMFPVTQGIQVNGGCFGFQIDGPRFTELITGGEPPTPT